MDSGGNRVMETQMTHSHHHNNNNHITSNNQMNNYNNKHGMREECGNGEEELSSLPRNTKVIVTGNNRTKSVLVGLQGVVKAVGLGGWHWLVLKNGEEVKLQRNALSILEHPSGKEEEGDCDNSFCSSSDRADHHHNNNNTNNNKDMDFSSLDCQKSTRPRVRHTRPAKRNRQKDLHSHNIKPHSRVDLSKLGTAALWRYWKHFNLVNLDGNLSKEQLLHGVRHHFLSMQIDEMQVIMSFIQSARRLKMLSPEIQ